MNYMKIKNIDIANGDGVRVSIFVSGCSIHCKGCFNQVAWDFNAGQEFTDETMNELLKDLTPDYIKGLTILGGEPMDNQEGVWNIIKTVREKLPQKDIWLYSGYYKDNIPKTNYTDDILNNINVLVDGDFEEDKKDITLKFKGSSNQRINYLR